MNIFHSFIVYMEANIMVQEQVLTKVVVRCTKTGEMVDVLEEEDLSRYPSPQYRQIKHWKNV